MQIMRFKRFSHLILNVFKLKVEPVDLVLAAIKRSIKKDWP